jgi:hypothetical protein
MALPSNCDVACLTLCSLAPPDRGRNPPDALTSTPEGTMSPVTEFAPIMARTSRSASSEVVSTKVLVLAGGGLRSARFRR